MNHSFWGANPLLVSQLTHGTCCSVQNHPSQVSCFKRKMTMNSLQSRL